MSLTRNELDDINLLHVEISMGGEQKRLDAARLEVDAIVARAMLRQHSNSEDAQEQEEREQR